MEKEKLDKLMEFLLVSLQESKDFAVEQAPQVAKEMISWGQICYGIGVFCFCLGGILTFCLGLWVWKRRNDDGYDHDGCVAGSVFSWALTLGLLAGMLTHVAFFCKATYAPRLYLIEQVSSLVKGK